MGGNKHSKVLSAPELSTSLDPSKLLLRVVVHVDVQLEVHVVVVVQELLHELPHDPPHDPQLPPEHDLQSLQSEGHLDPHLSLSLQSVSGIGVGLPEGQGILVAYSLGTFV